MLTNRIAYKGIARASSNEDVANGWLDEMINLRHRGGKLQAIGHKTKKWNVPGDETGTALTWEKIWYHDQDNISNFIGLTDTHELRLINMELSTSELIKSYSADVEVEVGFVKRFMIVVHEGGLDRYLYKKDEIDDSAGEYMELSVITEPKFTLSISDEQRIGSAETGADYVESAEALLGKFRARINKLSGDNFFTGGIMFRAAYKLFDGSYIMHTLPYYLTTENEMYAISKNSNVHTLLFDSAKALISFSGSDFSGMDNEKDIIQSVVLFASKAETHIEISESTITDTNLNEWLPDSNGYVFLNEKLTIADDFKDLPKSFSWYRVGEYSFAEILADEITSEEIDLEDFYMDYATRETMPVDQFSHHMITGANPYNYNGRLILSDVDTILSKYGVYDTDETSALKIEGISGNWTYTSDINIAVEFILDTPEGEKIVWKYQTVKEWSNAGSNFNALFLKGVIGYPDSRAKECRIYVDDLGTYKRIERLDLISSSAMNYSFFSFNQFSPADIDSSISVNSDTTTSENENFRHNWITYNRSSLPAHLTFSESSNDSYSDGNRIQISELNNPFFFPAENSYQVGTGRIITTASNTEPLSTGQYGEYPLIVFTTKGIWTLFQGTGNVLFSSIKPLNGEVPANKEQITSVGVGVTYTTNLGLFLIQGREVTELTQLLQGSPNIDIQLDANFQLRLNHLQLIQKAEFLSDIDALGYIEDAKIAFDKKNNELIVTNPNKLYSYLYSFDSGVWGKISQSFDILVNAYPVTYAIVSNGGVYSISDENFLTEVETVLTTRPYKLDDSNNFILLHRALQRCEIETKQSTFAGFYVFGSNDLITWQLISGNDRKSGRVTDILTTRAHTKVKYFVFVFASSVHKGDSINSLEVQFYNKLTNKLR